MLKLKSQFSSVSGIHFGANIITKKENKARGFGKLYFAQTESKYALRGRWEIDVRIKDYTWWVGKFSFFSTKIYLWVPFVELHILVWGFGAGCGGLFGGEVGHVACQTSIRSRDGLHGLFWDGCVWLVCLFPWSSVWAECLVLDLGSASVVLEET